MNPFQGLRVSEVGFDLGHSWRQLLSATSPVASSCAVRLGVMLGVVGFGGRNWPGNLGEEQQEGKETPEIWGTKGFGEDYVKSCRISSPVSLVGFAAANGQTNLITAIAGKPADVLHTTEVLIEVMRPCSGTFCGT